MVLQMAEVFVIHMALKVHPQGLRGSVCPHVHVWTSMCVCFCVCVCCIRTAEDAINACC